jgi:hypothetical protein
MVRALVFGLLIACWGCGGPLDGEEGAPSTGCLGDSDCAADSRCVQIGSGAKFCAVACAGFDPCDPRGACEVGFGALSELWYLCRDPELVTQECFADEDCFDPPGSTCVDRRCVG